LHLAGALFSVVTGTQLTHVPYKGGTAAATAILSGEATVAFSTIETIMPLLNSGRLKPLAVSTRERAAALPNVPTVAESGFKDYEVVGWFGIMAPAATPKPVVDLLSGEIAKAMATPGMRERAAQDGATPVGSTPAEFDRVVRAEIVKWTKVIHDAGIKLD
jgi:tripartite-type tricarboxylate transporter receptor subunit TctC